jgi:hypothetical protein
MQFQRIPRAPAVKKRASWLAMMNSGHLDGVAARLP